MAGCGNQEGGPRVIYTDIYKIIEQDIFGYLSSDQILGQRASALIEPGSPLSVVAAKVTKAVGAGKDGKVGIGWCVLPIEDMVDDEPEVNFGPLKLPICVDIVENVILNQGQRGPQIPIRMLAAYAQKILKPYSAQNLTSDLIPDKAAISLFSKHDDENLRFCRITLFTYEQDPLGFTQVNSPVLTPNNPVSQVPGQNVYPFQVTITPTNAAAVWYTTDGTHPYDLNPAAILWDGQSVINIAAPCFLRARGFNAPLGLLGSKCSSVYFA